MQELSLFDQPRELTLSAKDDICINKHRRNAQSLLANRKVNKDHDRAIVLDFIIKHGKAYSKQIARAMNKQLNQISGRISELKLNNIIEDTGERIEGCAVYKLKDV